MPLPITKQHIHHLAFINLFGDSIHNFIDGVIIEASYLVDIPTGIATAIAIILHEIPQEIADFGILLHSGLSKLKALLLNFITALTAVLGAVISLIINRYITSLTSF